MTDARPEFWIAMHTRSDLYDDDQLPVRAVAAETQEEAFELLLEMACITELQRAEHGLVHPKMDTYELCGTLTELTGDHFEAMLYERFVSRRAKHELPTSLRIENLIEEKDGPKVTTSHLEYRHNHSDVRLAAGQLGEELIARRAQPSKEKGPVTQALLDLIASLDKKDAKLSLAILTMVAGYAAAMSQNPEQFGREKVTAKTKVESVRKVSAGYDPTALWLGPKTQSGIPIDLLDIDLFERERLMERSRP